MNLSSSAKAKGHTISSPVEQQSLTFLATGTGFVEGNFSTDRVGGDGLGMIQAQYTYWALYFYYYYICFTQIIRH